MSIERVIIWPKSAIGRDSPPAIANNSTSMDLKFDFSSIKEPKELHILINMQDKSITAKSLSDALTKCFIKYLSNEDVQSLLDALIASQL